MRCTKNEPRESSSTSDSGLPTSSSAGSSEDAVVLFLAGFLTTLVFGRSGLAGWSCGFAGFSCGFLFQNESSPCQKKSHFQRIFGQKQLQIKRLYDSYSWRFVEGAEREQSGLGTDSLRFVQHFLYSVSNFRICKLNVNVSLSILQTPRVLTHQTGALA